MIHYLIYDVFKNIPPESKTQIDALQKGSGLWSELLVCVRSLIKAAAGGCLHYCKQCLMKPHLLPIVLICIFSALYIIRDRVYFVMCHGGIRVGRQQLVDSGHHHHQRRATERKVNISASDIAGAVQIFTVTQLLSLFMFNGRITTCDIWLRAPFTERVFQHTSVYVCVC